MKLLSYATMLFVLLFFFMHCLEVGFIKECNRRRKRVRETVVKTDKKIFQTDTTKIDTENRQDSIPQALQIPEWKEKKFRLLEKTKMFQKFGYELYTSPLFSEDTVPADSTVAHKNHRLKYEPFHATNITAIAVEKMESGEYLITFQTDTLNKIVYCRTRKGTVEGIALERDLDAAEKRWKGKTIFSRRRSITTYDSTLSRYKSVKISITEPLKVVSVRWGITPLPPKSLWLIVERHNGFRGFIPLNYSWTNVLRTEETAIFPWERDIFEQNPKEIFKWEDRIWETIDKHNICTQMTTEQVLFSWGEPISKQTGLNDDGQKITTYLYSGRKLVFRNDTLTLSSEIDVIESN